MSKTSMIHARVEPNLKSEVESVLKTLGLNATQAITMFYEQIRLNHGLPFEVKIPNDITAKAMQEAKDNINMEDVSIEELKNEVKPA